LVAGAGCQLHQLSTAKNITAPHLTSLEELLSQANNALPNQHESISQEAALPTIEDV